MTVILLSFAVLGLSAVFTTLTWALLVPLQILPRGVVSLLVFVTAYYLGANLIFWKTVVRISSSTAIGERA
jgi:hypothetical protein